MKLKEILDDADDGQEDCEPVILRITAGDARYLKHLVEKAEKEIEK